MTQSGKFARLVMARAARLHADQTGLKLTEKRQHLPTPQRPADDDLSTVVNRVNLENVLGQIEANNANIHGGWLLLLVVLDGNHTLAHCDAGSGSHPHHLL